MERLDVNVGFTPYTLRQLNEEAVSYVAEIVAMHMYWKVAKQKSNIMEKTF